MMLMWKSNIGIYILQQSGWPKIQLLWKNLCYINISQLLHNLLFDVHAFLKKSNNLFHQKLSSYAMLKC